MLGSTLKRSAATLAIVAGLLAAAVPAGAHVATAMQPNDALTAAKAPTTPEPAGKTMAEDSFTDVAWHQTVLEGLGARAAEFMTRHVLDEHEHIRRIRQAPGANLVLDAPLPEQFHGANPAPARLRVVGGSRRLLDHYAVDLVPMKQQPHGKADGAATDDDDGCRARCG